MEGKDLIEKVLKEGPQDLALEQTPSEEQSPLNEPVLEKDLPAGVMGSANSTAGQLPEEDNPEVALQESPSNTPDGEEIPPDMAFPGGDQGFPPSWDEEEEPPLDDAPEQPIGSGPVNGPEPESDFELPPGVAEQTADTFLGIANNLIEVGGGFFVRIPKDKSFYEFDEVVRILDDQSQRNIQRIKLDEEDKALLRPLIVQVLRQRAKQMTPEQQLIAAIVSILMKKVRVVAEIRRENHMLVDRIRDIVRDAKGPESPSKQEPDAAPVSNATAADSNESPSPRSAMVEEEVFETTALQPTNTAGLAEQVMEVSPEETDAE